MSSSTHTFEGKSSLTVVNGDYTLTCEVEDFSIEARDWHEDIYTHYSLDPITTFKSHTTYAIRGSNLVEREDGTYLTIKKAAVKSVERTATIEIKCWDLEQINEALVSCGAPTNAVPTYERRDGKHYVQFKWDEAAGKVGI